MVGLFEGEAASLMLNTTVRRDRAGLGPVGALPREGYVASAFGPGRGREEVILRAREFYAGSRTTDWRSSRAYKVTSSRPA